MIQLGRLAEVNPSVPEFDEIGDKTPITFMPLEACWPDGHADYTRRAAKAQVASGYTRFRDGDVLVPKITPTFEAGRVFQSRIATGVGAATTEVHVLRTLGDNDPRFVAYVARSQPFLQLGAASLRGVGNLRRVTADYVRTFPVAKLPGNKQARIADYLDRETAQIDTLIAKQDQLITTLRERRVTVAEAKLATRIGQGDRLRWHLREVDDRAGDGADSLPLLSVSISWGVKRRNATGLEDGRAEDLSQYKIVRTGDIVVNRMRAFQGALGAAPYDGLASPDYAVLRGGAEIRAQWLSATMKTPSFVGEIVSRLKGIGTTSGATVRTPRINVDDLLNIRVDMPRIDQQEVEYAAISKAIGEIDTLITKAERFIELSKERRAALITAAVTGQLEIPIAA